MPCHSLKILTGINDFNSHVDFEFAFLGEPRVIVDKNELIIPIRDLIVEAEMLPKCNVIFTGVSKSIRRIGEYDSDSPTNIKDKPQHIISDGPFSDPNQTIYFHELEGVFESSEGWSGWIYWTVESVNYKIVFANIPEIEDLT